MNNLFRFHLPSLLLSVLVAALLLGLSLTPRVEINSWIETSPQTYPFAEEISNAPPESYGMERICVYQGWPWRIREVRGLARGSPQYLRNAPFHHEWLGTQRINWSEVALNTVAVLGSAITILRCVEWLLRRLTEKRKTRI